MSRPLLGKLPDPDQSLKSGILLRLTSNFEWKPMFVVLAENSLNMARPENDSLLDIIPLAEIVKVKKRYGMPGKEGPNQHEAKESRSPQSRSRLDSVGSLGSFRAGAVFTSRPITSFFDGPIQEDLNLIQIQTIEGGYNSGRTYYFNASQISCDEWIQSIRQACETAKKDAQPSCFFQAQCHLRKFHESSRFQTFFACLIFLCFIANVLQTELQSPLSTPNATAAAVFSILEIFFTIAFAVELAVNLIANYFHPFICDPWNWFDCAVVTISLASLAVDSVPGVAALRLIRTLRFPAFA